MAPFLLWRTGGIGAMLEHSFSTCRWLPCSSSPGSTAKWVSHNVCTSLAMYCRPFHLRIRVQHRTVFAFIIQPVRQPFLFWFFHFLGCGNRSTHRLFNYRRRAREQRTTILDSSFVRECSLFLPLCAFISSGSVTRFASLNGQLSSIQ